ncbi:MAG: inositol monophosphatase family protein [Actinomycetes bacterium]
MILETDHDVARIVARQAGTLLNNLSAHAQSLPDSGNESMTQISREVLGQEGDRAAHELLSALLEKYRPADQVLSEEGVLDPGRHNAERLWIVDPLDGTSHFSRGQSDFAVHVALWDRESTQPSKISAASVYLPRTETMLSMDDEALLVPVDRDDIRVLVSKSRPPHELHMIVEHLGETFGKNVVVIPMGSVGAKVAHIISGQADMYINTGGFHEWDLAAPLGVAQHYGLTVCDRSGNSIVFNNQDTFIAHAVVSRPEFVAALIECLA